MNFNSRGHSTEYNVQAQKTKKYIKSEYRTFKKCAIQCAMEMLHKKNKKNYPPCMSHCELSQNGTKKTLKRRHSGSIIK